MPFISQVEVCRRLGLSRPTHNKMRKAGVLPGFFPGSHLYFWPQVIAALEKASGADCRALLDKARAADAGEEGRS